MDITISKMKKILFSSIIDCPKGQSPEFAKQTSMGRIKKILFSSIIMIFLLASCKFGVGVEPAPGGGGGEVPAETMKVATPVLGVATSVQTATFLLAITTNTPGAVIYYTTDGTDPTKESTKYTASFLVDRTMTVKAKAYLTGWTDSDISSSTYTFEVQDPVISPTLDTNSSYPVQAVINVNTAGASVYYKLYDLNGTLRTDRTLYTAPVAVDKNSKLEAVAEREGWTSSAVISTEYTFKVTDPVISPDLNATNYPLDITIVDYTDNAKIYYTTDGTDPNSSSGVLYTGQFQIEGLTTIRTIAKRDGWYDSEEKNATFIFELTDPIISPSDKKNGNEIIFLYPFDMELVTYTIGAEIYYTMDNSTPTTSSTKYVKGSAIPVDRGTIVKAIAVKNGWEMSGISEVSYTFKVTDPVVSPAGGNYTNAATVQMKDYTVAADVYYTVDGSDPVTNGVKYTTPITVDGNTTVRAIGRKENCLDSDEVNATFNFTVNDPVITPEGGSFTNDANVTIVSNTSGATIYYTIDGSDPLSSGTRQTYSAPFMLGTNCTLKAVAVKTGYTSSNVVSKVFGFSVFDPVVSSAGGTFNNDLNVTLATYTTGASMYYTTDGSTPTGNSTVYSGSFELNSTCDLKVIAIKSGYTNSNIIIRNFNFVVNTPVVGSNGGTFNNDFNITIADYTEEAAIYYTTDGSTPTGNSTLYSGSFELNSTCDLKVIAKRSGYSDSSIVTKSFTFVVNTPVMSPEGGSYSNDVTVTLADYTDGAAIYYTTDGATPTASSNLYSSPFTVGGSSTVKAIAIRSGYSDSSVVSNSFTLTAGTPYVSPNGGNYSSPVQVSIGGATTGATVYYTVDGSDPTSSGTRKTYSSSFEMNTTNVVKTYAVKSGYSDSSVVTSSNFAFTVGDPVISPNGGTYNGPTQVTLVNYTSGFNEGYVKLYYTIDGSTPTESSTLYSSPFYMNEGGTLKVLATRTGWTSSSVTSATFYINEADINVTISGTDLSTKGKIMLMDSSDNVLEIKDGNTSSTVTFDNSSNLYKFHNSSGIYSTYNLYYFTDADSDGVYDANSFDENSSRFLLKSVAMASYIGSGNINAGSYQINKYYGTITYHSDWSDTARRYLYAYNSFTGIERVIPVESNGTFELYTKKPVPESKVSIYTFEDNSSNQNKQMNELEDRICFLLSTNEHYKNTYISESMKKVYGNIVFNNEQSNTIYDFDSSTNKPVIKIEDQAYWMSFYQTIATNGDFGVYVASGHSVDIRMYDVMSTVSNYSTNYKDYVRFPVKLAGATSYSSDTQLKGVDTNSSDSTAQTEIEIFQHLVKIENNGTSYSGNDLYLNIGQSAIPVKLYQLTSVSDLNITTTAANGAGDTSGTLYKAFFRDFDRTTSTDGILNDVQSTTDIDGYGAFARFQAFIDINNDGIMNPGEPASNTYYYGDTNSDGIPNWGVDYDDTVSASYLTSDGNHTANVLTIP